MKKWLRKYKKFKDLKVYLVQVKNAKCLKLFSKMKKNKELLVVSEFGK